MHHKILMSTNAPTSRFGLASLWCKEEEAWSILLFYLFILFIFNNGLSFTGAQGFLASEIWASKMSFRSFNHMAHTPSLLPFFFSWTLGSHGPSHTQKTSPLECKPTLVLLGKSMLQWSCSATFFFFFSRTLTNHGGFLQVPHL